jgi:hypothetical protein
VRAYAAAALLTALALAGCSPDDPVAEPSKPPPTSSATASSPASASPSDVPEVVDPTLARLDWTPAPGRVSDTITVAGDWTLTVTEKGDRALLRGPTQATVIAGRRGRISEALIDGKYAVIVVSDKLEEQPGRATVVDLATGDSFTLDGGSDVPTVNGGTWALGEGHVLHATYGPGRAYCLASVDLASGDSTITWCAPARNGFSNARIAPGGDSLMTFDDSQPSCRSVVAVDGDTVTELPGVTPCKAWDAVLLTGSRVWSVVPKDGQIEAAHLYAAAGDAAFDLGPGKSGTLVACHGAAYFARDPQRDGDPAQVLRWSDDGSLSVVYESPAGGPAFIAGPPRCGGDRLTVTALTAGGDEQVVAVTP